MGAGALEKNASDLGLKHKDQIGMAWRVAFALQDDGWWLRRDNVWAKRNPTPESAKDRPVSSHEFVFLLTKRAHYFYDHVAVKTPLAPSSVAQYRQPYEDRGGKDYEGSGAQDGRAIKARMTGKMNVPSSWNTAPGAHGSVHPDGRAQQPEYRRWPGIGPKHGRAPRPGRGLRGHGHADRRQPAGRVVDQPGAVQGGPLRDLPAAGSPRSRFWRARARPAAARRAVPRGCGS